MLWLWLPAFTAPNSCHDWAPKSLSFLFRLLKVQERPIQTCTFWQKIDRYTYLNFVITSYISVPNSTYVHIFLVRIEVPLIVGNTFLLLLFALFYKPRFINNKSPLVPTGSNNHLHKAQLSGATLVPSLSSLLAVVASSKSCQQVLEHANEVNISWQILGTSSLLLHQLSHRELLPIP